VATWPDQDQQLYDLHVRRELCGAELAAELCVTPAAAAQRSSDLRVRLRNAFGAEVLVRSGWRGCRGLRRILKRCDHRGDAMTTAQRQAVLRHISHCDDRCDEYRTRAVRRWTPVLVPLLHRPEVPATPDVELASWTSDVKSSGHPPQHTDAASTRGSWLRSSCRAALPITAVLALLAAVFVGLAVLHPAARASPTCRSARTR
jgi:hypothetical protein